MMEPKKIYPSQEQRADIEMRVSALQTALGIPNRTTDASALVTDAETIYAFIKKGLDNAQ